MFIKKNCLFVMLLTTAFLGLAACFPEVPESATALPTVTKAASMTPVIVDATDIDEEDTCTDSQTGASMKISDAQRLAQSSECIVAGPLMDSFACNEVTGTWWIDLDVNEPGCKPACVVDIGSGTTGINWRCTGAIPPDEQETPATGQKTPEPTLFPTQPPITGSLEQVTFEGVTFTYNAGLASNISPRSIGITDFLIIDGAIIPAHVEFSFVGYILPETFHKPKLIVYPVDKFIAGNELVLPIIQRLERLLAQKPANPEGALPFLPLFNAGPLIQTQIRYQEFQSGQGVRYVTQFGQAYLPINNRSLFYTYQGLTTGGDYYVSFVLPVSHPSLPPDESEVPGGDPEAFVNNFERYAAQITDQLNIQDGSTFFPPLPILDAMVQSIIVDEVLIESTLDRELDFSDWQLYQNDVLGYRFFVPPGLMVRQIEGESGPTVFISVDNSEPRPLFSVSHYESEFFRPPEGTEVGQWVLSHGIPHDSIEHNVIVGGLPAVRLITNPTPASYGFEEYYVIHAGQLIRISFWLLDAAIEPIVVDQILAGIEFP